jgi:hypothetical protein
LSLAQRFERRLESMVGSAFARVFKGQVEPVEIGSALQREALDKKAVMGSGQVLAPNRYRVTLGNSDYERLVPWEAPLTASLAELVQEYLDENGIGSIGDVEVYLARDESLHTGVFGVASRMESQAPPRRRPYDSMSMPVVPGHPDEYVQPLSPQPVAPVPGPMAGSVPGAMQGPYPPVGPPQGPGAPYAGGGYPQAPYPAPPQRRPLQAKLLVDATGETHELKPGSNIVGRGHDSDLQLLDQGVSRRHLDVHVADGRVIVYDLGSTNGTAVNGHPVQSQELRHGDVVRIGHSRLVFQQDGA